MYACDFWHSNQRTSCYAWCWSRLYFFFFIISVTSLSQFINKLNWNCEFSNSHTRTQFYFSSWHRIIKRIKSYVTTMSSAAKKKKKKCVQKSIISNSARKINVDFLTASAKRKHYGCIQHNNTLQKHTKNQLTREKRGGKMCMFCWVLNRCRWVLDFGLDDDSSISLLFFFYGNFTRFRFRFWS